MEKKFSQKPDKFGSISNMYDRFLSEGDANFDFQGIVHSYWWGRKKLFDLCLIAAELYANSLIIYDPEDVEDNDEDLARSRGSENWLVDKNEGSKENELEGEEFLDVEELVAKYAKSGSKDMLSVEEEADEDGSSSRNLEGIPTLTNVKYQYFETHLPFYRYMVAGISLTIFTLLSEPARMPPVDSCKEIATMLILKYYFRWAHYSQT